MRLSTGSETVLLNVCSFAIDELVQGVSSRAMLSEEGAILVNVPSP
ncbi:MAG: hypothetical protein V7606_4691 [Burkholderiales bacterium]|jgi:hypothetical protein